MIYFVNGIPIKTLHVLHCTRIQNKSITFVIILISTKINVEGMRLGNLKQLV